MLKKLFRSLVRSQAKEAQPDFVYDQAVIITIYFDGLEDFGTKEQQAEIGELEDKLAKLLPSMSGVDGDDFGDGECTIYLYGPSADKIFSCIEQELMKSPFSRTDITLQYGLAEDANTIEKKFSL